MDKIKNVLRLAALTAAMFAVFMSFDVPPAEAAAGMRICPNSSIKCNVTVDDITVRSEKGKYDDAVIITPH